MIPKVVYHLVYWLLIYGSLLLPWDYKGLTLQLSGMYCHLNYQVQCQPFIATFIWFCIFPERTFFGLNNIISEGKLQISNQELYSRKWQRHELLSAIFFFCLNKIIHLLKEHIEINCKRSRIEWKWHLKLKMQESL